MKEVRNKRLVLAGLVVLALLLAGTAAIAIFQETLRALINAQTGNFDIVLAGFTMTVDNEPPDGPNIASCSAPLNPNNPREVSVLIQNAYPGYECKVSIFVVNTGTIHARFENFNVDPSSPALSVQILQAPAGIIAPNNQAQVDFKITVTNQALENAQYSVTLNLVFRQALP
ncbi:MAG: hypothetical protein N3D79_01645 [Acidilobaceae archaeon]|nr:hypothetical protein [Acidilobaceae archaeon]